MNRIICIGNRYFAPDAAGPRTYDALSTLTLPADIEIVDGGTAGLNLLGLIDGADRVVFVDAVAGYADGPAVVVLDPSDVPPPQTAYDHAAGLPYLLSILSGVCERMPAVSIVGIEGSADQALIERAAGISLRIAGGTVFTRGGNHVVAG